MRVVGAREVAVVGLVCALAGCSSNAATPVDKATCARIHAQREPDLMAWEPSARGLLAAVRQQGIAVVRYEGEGCDARLEVLSSCMARGQYQFHPYWESNSKIARTAKELFTELPLGAAKLSSKLHDEHALRTDYMLAGMAQIPIEATYGVGDLVLRPKSNDRFA